MKRAPLPCQSPDRGQQPQAVRTDPGPAGCRRAGSPGRPRTPPRSAGPRPGPGPGPRRPAPRGRPGLAAGSAPSAGACRGPADQRRRPQQPARLTRARAGHPATADGEHRLVACAVELPHQPGRYRHHGPSRLGRRDLAPAPAQRADPVPRTAANDHRHRATPGHGQPFSPQPNGTLGHTGPRQALPRECLLSSRSRVRVAVLRGGSQTESQRRTGPKCAS